MRKRFAKKPRCNSKANFFTCAGIINCMNRLRNDRLCSRKKHLGVRADNQPNPSHQCCGAEEKTSIMLMCTSCASHKLSATTASASLATCISSTLRVSSLPNVSPTFMGVSSSFKGICGPVDENVKRNRKGQRSEKHWL